MTNTERNRDRLNRTVAWFNSYKSNLKCSECGESHISCIDFHHIDTQNKDKDVSQLVWKKFSIERILEEISKCIVLCSNCHRKSHWRDIIDNNR